MDHSYYVHHFDPFLIRFSDHIGIRYYGLAYVVAFVIGAMLLRLYYKRGKSPLAPKQQSDALVALVLGVFVGGRLGYVFLYDFSEFLRNPLIVVKVWEGGMSSHGGFLGVLIASGWLSWKFKLSLPQLGDIVVTLVPPGLFLGRLANFINGELWGKVTDVWWGVIFPHSAPFGAAISSIPPRHPSQLYEAVLEGLVLLAFTQWRFWKTQVGKFPGQLSGEFFVLYAILRIAGEQFRQPDAPMIMGLSRGIFYSLFLLGLGGFLIPWSHRRNR